MGEAPSPMGSNLHLIIHNVVCIASAITALGAALLLFLNGQKKTANITFACTFLVAVFFTISHVIGVNIADPNLSRMVFMLNLSVLFIGAFNLHAVMAVIHKDKENASLIASIYATAVIITVFFCVFPDLFLLPSVPKMYFPSYYVPGPLNWVRLFFLYGVTFGYSIIQLYRAYRQAPIGAEKKQLKFFFITMIIGYGIAFIPNFLFYNIQVDPLWGMLFVVVCSVPLVYGALQYEMFDVRVIAKEAFLYSLAVGVIGGLIVLINYSTVWIQTIYPHFPTWTLALLSSVLVVSISIIVWRNLRRSDVLKAEFITTVTHKFRTPLTYIKWASENIENPATTPEERKVQVDYIRSANQKLVELTNILTTTSEAENKEFEYQLKRNDFSRTVNEVITSLEDQFAMKKIQIADKIQHNIFAKYDIVRMKFVIQVLLENALHYSPDKAVVIVSVYPSKKDVIFSVKDNGVGMSPTQISLIFSKFYRSNEALHLDTEGMGIGLYVAKRIIEKHEGRIWAESDGIGKGSTFYISLPRVA